MAKVPSERSLAKKYKDQPFRILGVNADAAAEDLAQRTLDAGIAWRSFQDGMGGPIAAAWGIRAFPTTFLIDHEGVIRGRDLHGAELESMIEELLAAVPN